MSRRLVPVVIVGCLVVLISACFGQALWRGGQFAYRDSAHFYYPLYQRVQAEWEAGRWPLWEPEENGGMPLLGNPTAAVLYPGKVIYAVLPYAWAARLYVVAHTVLAFTGMLVLMRSWGTSATGSALASLGYAFGIPVLFQYCNIIYLVGAAWLPLGFHGANRWLRLGRRWGLIELALVLAMQTLGGDPESAYVLGLCAGGEALALARTWSWPSRWQIVGSLLAWVAATLVLAAWLPAFRPPREGGRPELALPWMTWVPLGFASAWGFVGLFLLARWRRLGWRSRLGTMLVGLLAAAVLAGGVAAVQLLPVLEFTGQSSRAAGQGPHDIFPFSLEPTRLVEFIWPNVFGTPFQGNRSWLNLIPPARLHSEVWVPSLYLGGLTFLFALGALGFRDGPAWRGWLSAILIVTLLASLGKFTGPLWWARWFPAGVARLGPHDPPNTTTIRLDGFFRDGDGSFYWFLATVLPGFRQFRFPSKLLSFTALALAGLAGPGWDRLAMAQGRDRRLVRLAAVLFVLSLLSLVVAIVKHDGIVAVMRRATVGAVRSPFGPFDPDGAYRELCRSLSQAAVVTAIGLGLVIWCRRGAGLAGVLALLVTTVDLGLANARYVLTVPQRLMETTPKIVRLLAEAERRNPSPTPGPFRVHRMPLWEPVEWSFVPSPDRVRDFVVWERDMIQPKYGLPYGVQYTLTLGVAELYDYEWFFGGFPRTIDAMMARALGAKEGQKIVVYPRRGFNMWNTRYFVLPAFPNGWNDEQRGYAAFLPDTEPVYPDPKDFEGPGGYERRRKWLEGEDVQILRNKEAYPRAWVVHSARSLKAIAGLERTDREAPMEELLFDNDLFWHDQNRVVYDPHILAWIDADRRPALHDYLPGGRPGAGETVTVTSYGPQRVELDVVLEQPGLVVLADVYYPGWRLTIDDVEAPIYRANRVMRGAAVRSGRHRLVYTYAPRSFVIGASVTLAALTVLVGLAVVFTVRPVTAVLMPLPDRPTDSGSTPLKPDTEVLE